MLSAVISRQHTLRVGQKMTVDFLPLTNDPQNLEITSNVVCGRTVHVVLVGRMSCFHSTNKVLIISYSKVLLLWLPALLG